MKSGPSVFLPRHPGLDPGSMNTDCANLARQSSWILTFVRMTLLGYDGRESPDTPTLTLLEHAA